MPTKPAKHRDDHGLCDTSIKQQIDSPDVAIVLRALESPKVQKALSRLISKCVLNEILHRGRITLAIRDLLRLQPRGTVFVDMNPPREARSQPSECSRTGQNRHDN